MKFNFPHPIVILLGFILAAGLATYLIPSGSFERVLDPKTGRELVIPGSFHSIQDVNASVFDVFSSIPAGIIAGADILVLILLIGSSFYVIEKTGALQIGIEALIYRFRRSEYVLLYLLSIAFGLAGATIALQEEIIAMVPLLVLLARKLAYDIRSIIALALGSALVGGAFSPVNPFGSLLAQNLAELNFGEGLIYRLVFLFFAVLSWASFHIYFGKTKDLQTENQEIKPVQISFRNGLILFLTFAGIGVMGWGITQRDWGYNEMSALFFVVGFACGLIGKLGLNGTAAQFTVGFGEMIFAGVIVGLSRSVYLILEDSSVIDPLIFALFEPLEAIPSQLAAIGLFISQAIIHLAVPSTSGQAVLTIPLATPLVDLLGLSRQIVVLTYQYPAALMDLVIPNNGGMMAVIAAAGIKYNHWISYIWKSWLLLMSLGLISVLFALIWFS
jgi:uncharacterized ion transporter superfamily protein YfcC